MKKTLRLIALCGLAVTYADTVAWAGTDKLATELRADKVAGSIEVIVQYKVTPTEAHHARVAALGGKLHAKMDFIKARTTPFPNRPCRRSRTIPTSLTSRPIVRSARHSTRSPTAQYTPTGPTATARPAQASASPWWAAGTTRWKTSAQA